MISFLHSFEPTAKLASFGWLNIYWYGLFITLGILAALTLTIWLAKHYGLSRDLIFDLSFWLIISGLIGARIYEVFLVWPYYRENPLQIFQVWQGGLAIHGAIIAGLAIIWLFSHFKKINFWKLTAVFVPGLALGQAIGRWGNYFNQELFGRPTAAPWGIPINPLHRPLEYIGSSHFHPTFLYESAACLLIFLILLFLNIYFIKKKSLNLRFYAWSTALYMILYSALRFGLEFIRLDETVSIWGWRWPQIISLIIVAASILLIYKAKSKIHVSDNNAL